MEPFDDDRTRVIDKEGSSFRVRNKGLLQSGRIALLLGCWVTGIVVLVSGRGIGFGIFLMLLGIWFILVNPLENLAVIEGACPFCGHTVRGLKRDELRCHVCMEVIAVGSDCFQTRDNTALPDRHTPVEGASEATSQDEPVLITLGDTLDLHTFSPIEVPSLLYEYIKLCQEAKIRSVRIIHGKGTGTLRRRVHSLLVRDSRVVSFSEAPPKSGGWGATVVELRSSQHTDDDAGE